jgi:hypothetical protein
MEDSTPQYITRNYTTNDNTHFANAQANDVWMLKMDINPNTNSLQCPIDPSYCISNYTTHSAYFYEWTLTITYDPPPVFAKPTLSSPTNNVNVSGKTVTLSWNAVNNATDYYVVVYNCTKNDALIYSNWVGSNSTSKTLSVFGDTGDTYSWRVKAHNSAVESPLSDYGYFVNGKPPISAAPSLISPDNRIFSSSNITFKWSLDNNADSYHFYISADPNFPEPPLPLPGSSALSLDKGSFTPGRKYYWKVAAANYHGTGPDSEVRQFVVGATAECWPEIGTGNGQTHIDTCYDIGSNPEIYRLKDISRRENLNVDGHNGKMKDGNSIMTQLYRTDTQNDDFVDGDNKWDATGQKHAVDAHVYTAMVYDWLYSAFGRNSYDGNGSTMLTLLDSVTVGKVEDICRSPNAYFSPTTKTVNVCLGSSSFISRDIMTHEWAHGITDSTSRLWHQKEPGALDEAFSDWMALERKQLAGAQDWNVRYADDSVLRNLSDPSASPDPQPVIYKKSAAWTNVYKNTPNWGETEYCDPVFDNDYCSVHRNSGVPNKMFYLISMGGSQYEVDVAGITLDRAIQIAYKANITKWSGNEVFDLAKKHMISAAGSTNEAYQVQNAWAAVGVGDIPAITTSASSPEAGKTLAYRAGAKLHECTPVDNSCMANFRYPSTCCSSNTYYSSWGRNVTVEAIPQNGYKFVRWTENGTEVSRDLKYTVTTDGARTLAAEFEAAPPLAFGPVYLGLISSMQNVAIANYIQPLMYFGTATLTGANPSDFSIVSDTCSNSALELNQGGCEIQIAFTPQLFGQRDAALTVLARDGQTVLGTYYLTGNGIVPSVSLNTSNSSWGSTSLDGSLRWGTIATASATPNQGYAFGNWTDNGVVVSSSPTYSFVVSGNRSLVANFTATPPALSANLPTDSFGTVYVGKTSTQQTVTVTNTGSQALTLGTVNLSGTNPAEFAKGVDTCSGKTLAPAATCTVQVAFTPASAGTKSATVAFPSTAPSTPLVSMTGIGAYPTLTVYRGGTATGTVTSTPAGIACGQTCSGPFTAGTTVSLTATPDTYSSFTGWSGACSGTGACTVALNGNAAVTAVFAMDTAHQTNIGAGYYSTIQQAYKAAAGGSVIKLWANTYNESLLCDRPVATTLKGGYDPSYTTITGDAVLAGSLSVTDGTVELYGITLGGQVTTSGYPTPRISISPATGNLGNAYVGATSPPHTFTVTNSGSQPLSIGTISLSGYNAVEFAKSADACSGQTLAPAATCTVQVTITAASLGTKAATLNIPSNDPSAPTFSASLTATGAIPTLTVTKSGTGTGTVTSVPAGISCGTSCSSSFATGTQVILTAQPYAGSVFSGWAGACGGTGSCVVNMNTSQSVSATFVPDITPVLMLILSD